MEAQELSCSSQYTVSMIRFNGYDEAEGDYSRGGEITTRSDLEQNQKPDSAVTSLVYDASCMVGIRDSQEWMNLSSTRQEGWEAFVSDEF